MSATKWALAAGGAALVLVGSLPVVVTITGLPTGQPAGGNLCAVIVNPGARQTWAADQLQIAATALQVAKQRGLPTQAVLVILAAGLQESGLHNLDHGNLDSLGWLQQRANWGSVAERMNPATAAAKFLDALVLVPGWQTMPITAAAQAVQVSAYPDAYARWEPAARQMLALLGTTPAGQCSPGGGPVPASFDQLGNPRTVEQAITMMTSHPHGWGGYGVVGHCEGYMTRAYGWPGGYPTARAHWDAPGPRSAGYSIPPRGALVFFDTGNPAGHVALSLGAGRVVSTDFDGQSYHPGMIAAGPITAIDRWGQRLGWRPPAFRTD